jgi:catechol 2,3-dioxygenase-like lactoylglutathione lyase family enzyme
MIDHISIQCADASASAAFYDRVLEAIGCGRVMAFGDTIGYGPPGRPEFWIGPLEADAGFRQNHLAFSAPDRPGVQSFFDAALACGAEVLHPPRLWPAYHPSYFAAFVRDPDGNNVEAVCHTEDAPHA